MSTDGSAPVQVADKAMQFADLLGFASLTEQYPFELDRVGHSDRRLWHLENMIGSPPTNPLTHHLQVSTGL
jgi:hypothetical protein